MTSTDHGRADTWHGNVEFRTLSPGGLSAHAETRIVLCGNASKWVGGCSSLGTTSCTSNATGAKYWLPIWMSNLPVRSGWRSRAVPCRCFWPLHEAWAEVVGGRRGRVTEDWASSSLTSRWDGRPRTQGLGPVMHAGRDRPPDLGETKASGFRKPMLLWSSRPATGRPAWATSGPARRLNAVRSSVRGIEAGSAHRRVRPNAPKSQAPASFRGPKYRQSVCPRPNLNG
jgi:hypothetical protein